MKPRDLYARVARLWAAVFALVGAAFLLAPTQVGTLLTRLAHLLRLEGQIAAPGPDLWWVLALSLMSSITVLALASAERPDDPTPYRALMTAKLVSTAGFAGLALTQGSSWAICSIGDGFVALTLWLAHRRVDGAPSPSTAGGDAP